LFYIENKIGEYQLRIMRQFPDSRLLRRSPILIAGISPEAKLEDVPDKAHTPGIETIWSFKSRSGVELNVKSDSVDLSSTSHKTYDNPSADYRFRDMIEFSVNNFLEIVSIPVISRIGLRYIDECPVPEMNNAAFQAYYNTTFPLDRFPVSDAIQMDFRTRISKDDYFLNFREFLDNVEREPKFILDFDGYAQDVDTGKYLEVTDDLHTLIIDEWVKSIKDPVFEYMRRGKE
jgi:uncharacterized protein (TIGR04255 family)